MLTCLFACLLTTPIAPPCLLAAAAPAVPATGRISPLSVHADLHRHTRTNSPQSRVEAAMAGRMTTAASLLVAAEKPWRQLSVTAGLEMVSPLQIRVSPAHSDRSMDGTEQDKASGQVHMCNPFCSQIQLSTRFTGRLSVPLTNLTLCGAWRVLRTG